MKVLNIISSPRGQRSASLKVATRFVEALSERVPGLEIDELDVWKANLLPFDGAALDAKYADLTGVDMTTEQKAVWRQIDELGSRFRTADIILFSVPMWNFGVPYRLKHLIDMVSQRGVLFAFDANGMRGLLTTSKVVVCASRGVALGPDYPTEQFDHQVAYLQTWARMVGIKEFHVVLNEATLGGADVANQNLAAGLAQASSLALSI